MDRILQKRSARHIRSVKNRHDRFIASYIKANHSEVFAEAKAFYEELNVKHPQRRDLTKTDDFIAKTTKYKSAYEMYRSRYETKSKENQQKDTFTLEIPLMSKKETEITTMYEKADPSLDIPEDVYQSILKDLQQDPVTSMYFKQNTEKEEGQPNSNGEQVNDLLEELNAILPQVLDQPEYEDILPEIPEQTELEKELENIIYE